MIGVCKFCQCTEDRPCMIPLSRDRFEGFSGIAFPGVPALGQSVPCAWLLEDVCDAPPCVEKAYFEARAQAEALMMQLALQEVA